MFAQIAFRREESPVPIARSRTLRRTNITSSIAEVVGTPESEEGSSSWKAFSTERLKKKVSSDSNELRSFVTFSARREVLRKDGISNCGLSYCH